MTTFLKIQKNGFSQQNTLIREVIFKLSMVSFLSRNCKEMHDFFKLNFDSRKVFTCLFPNSFLPAESIGGKYLDLKDK